MQYPAAYSITRIDIRNDPTQRYTDVGLRAGGASGLKEISVYAWPAGDADGNASLILNGVLARAGTVFKDFNVLERDLGDGRGYGWPGSAFFLDGPAGGFG